MGAGEGVSFSEGLEGFVQDGEVGGDCLGWKAAAPVATTPSTIKWMSSSRGKGVFLQCFAFLWAYRMSHVMYHW